MNKKEVIICVLFFIGMVGLISSFTSFAIGGVSILIIGLAFGIYYMTAVSTGIAVNMFLVIYVIYYSTNNHAFMIIGIIAIVILQIVGCMRMVSVTDRNDRNGLIALLVIIMFLNAIIIGIERCMPEGWFKLTLMLLLFIGLGALYKPSIREGNGPISKAVMAGLTAALAAWLIWYAFEGSEEVLPKVEEETQEETTTFLESQTEDETTNNDEETTEETTTTAIIAEEEPSGSDSSSDKKGGSSSSARQEPKTEKENSSAMSEKKSQLGIVEGDGLKDETVMSTRHEGQFEPSKEIKPGSSSDSTVIAKDPAPSEEPPQEVEVKNPFEDESTKRPSPDPTEEPTKKPSPDPTEEPTKKPNPNPTEAPTKKPSPNPTEEPTKKPSQTPTEELAEASIGVSYRHGANVANVSVTLSKKVNADISISWRSGMECEKQLKKNSDGTYSIKIEVPENFKDTLIISVTNNGNEIGYKTKIINNLSY